MSAVQPPSWTDAQMNLDDPVAMQNELKFFKLLAMNAPDFDLETSRMCADPSKAGTGRRFAHFLPKIQRLQGAEGNSGRECEMLYN